MINTSAIFPSCCAPPWFKIQVKIKQQSKPIPCNAVGIIADRVNLCFADFFPVGLTALQPFQCSSIIWQRFFILVNTAWAAKKERNLWNGPFFVAVALRCCDDIYHCFEFVTFFYILLLAIINLYGSLKRGRLRHQGFFTCLRPERKLSSIQRTFNSIWSNDQSNFKPFTILEVNHLNCAAQTA